MAAWQRISDDKWFDPLTRDFTSSDPIEMDWDAFKRGGFDHLESIPVLLPLFGLAETDVERLWGFIRIEKKETNYGR